VKADKGEKLDKKTVVQDQQFDEESGKTALPDRRY